MNELLFGNKIRQALNQGARLDPVLRERLRAARTCALLRRRAAPASGDAVASDVLSRFGGPGGFSFAVIVPALLLVIGLASLYSAKQTLVAAEKVDIDTRLLADELPIDAYLDTGLEAWLKKQRGN